MNLLSNAVKYTPDGGTVTFELWQEEIPGTKNVRLLSRVSDTGIGMSQEYMKNMYDKFNRAVDTRVNKVRGSGLGLSIVKELVDMMHGTIETESALGKGTTFHLAFTFPYLDDTENEAAPSREPDLSDTRGMRLLVAEADDSHGQARGVLTTKFSL